MWHLVPWRTLPGKADQVLTCLNVCYILLLSWPQHLCRANLCLIADTHTSLKSVLLAAESFGSYEHILLLQRTSLIPSTQAGWLTTSSMGSNTISWPPRTSALTLTYSHTETHLNMQLKIQSILITHLKISLYDPGTLFLMGLSYIFCVV